MEQRIIKFKAKRLDNGEWAEGDLYHNVRGFECCIGQQEKEDVYVYPVDPSTVCQYTGLKDNYGMDIWEHDIITIAKGREPCEVTFWNGCFIAVNSKGIHTTIAKGLDYYNWDLRVIGNKFDRKEGEV